MSPGFAERHREAYHKTLSPGRNQFSRFLVGCLILQTAELGGGRIGGPYGLFRSQISSGSFGLPQPSRSGTGSGYSRSDASDGGALGQVGISRRREGPIASCGGVGQFSWREG